MSADKKQRRAALMRGFWSGLAGPANLFAEPRRVVPVKVEIKKLHRSITNPVDAARSDWMQVGADIYGAIKKQKQAA